MAKADEKRVEEALIRAVGLISGRDGVGEDEENRWPDGWLTPPGGARIPAEVVRAFPRRNDEEPTKGAAYQRNHAIASKKAKKLADETGQPVSFQATPEGFTVLDGTNAFPVDTRPLRRAAEVAAAVNQKAGKNYASGPVAPVLIVETHGPLAFDRHEVEVTKRAIGELAAVPFSEVWIVNDYGDPPTRVW